MDMVLRVCILVTTYNDPESISDLIKNLVLETPFPLLVIDDGSESPLESRLYSFDVRNAIESGRVRLVRNQKRRGRAKCFQTALKDLAAEGFTHILTVENSLPSTVNEIKKLIEEVKRNPWDLLIGSRMKPESLGEKAGRSFWRQLLRYLSGQGINDPLSSYRVYPIYPLQMSRFFGFGREFEMEILARALWRGISIREIPLEIQTSSPKLKWNRARVLDALRVTLMNSALVIRSLVKNHRTSKDIAVATGIGIMIGCTPFTGIQTIMAFLVALLARLNVVAVGAGSLISIPPFTTLLTLASIYIGGQWLGVPLTQDPVLPHFDQWLKGSLVVGAALGVFVSVLILAMGRLADRFKCFRARIENRYDQWLRALVGRFGVRAGYFMAGLMAPFSYLGRVSERRSLVQFYGMVRPEFGFFRRHWRIWKHLYRRDQIHIDFMALKSGLKLKADSDWLDYPEQGRLLLGARFGAWKLAPELSGVDAFNGFIPHYQTSNFQIYQSLKLGQAVGLFCDRPDSDRIELIPFFGRLAPFDLTPFRVAVASNCPVIFLFGLKTSRGQYRFFAQSARRYRFANDLPHELQLYAWAEQFVRTLEDFVGRYPEEWQNFYPFWSSIPKNPAGGVLIPPEIRFLEELPIPDEFASGFQAPSAPRSEVTHSTPSH